MSAAIRCFVAVELPGRVRDAVSGFFEREGAAVRGVKWVGREQLHFTLKFLGPVAEERVPAAAAAVQAVLECTGCFTVGLRGAGAFPSPARPRVIWVGADAGAAALASLARLTEEALGPLGFPPEERPFAAHVTVGRVKAPPRDPAPLRRLLEAARDLSFGAFLVPAVRLVRSDLFPSGPRYTILQEIRLGGAPREAPRQGSER